MARRDVGRLRDYLSLITKKHGGIKAQIAGLKAQPERLSPGGLESATSEPPPATLALRGMEKIERNREPSPAELFGLEAIINEDLRPAVDVVDGNTSQLLVHTEKGSQLYAHLLAQLVQPSFPMPMGILYRADKPTYEQLAIQQVDDAIAKQGKGDLTKLMYSGMVWEVGADGTRH